MAVSLLEIPSHGGVQLRPGVVWSFNILFIKIDFAEHRRLSSVCQERESIKSAELVSLVAPVRTLAALDRNLPQVSHKGVQYSKYGWTKPL